MGGNWNPSSINPRPGAYINFESSGSTPVEPGEFGRVGMPIKAEWGPENTFVDIVTDAERVATYGNTDGDTTSTTDTSWLIREAIIGGSELVKAYRIVDTGTAAAATCVLTDDLLQNTLDLTAKYTGLRSNSFSVTVGPSILSGRSVLSVVETVGTASTTLESFVYTTDVLAPLVDDINANSNFLVAAFSAGADPEVSELTTIDNAAGVLTAGDFELVMDFGDGNGPLTTASILFNASDIVAIQAAMDATMVIGGYAAGDLVASLTAGGPGLDTAATTITITPLVGGGLENQNISITLADGNSDLVPALGGSLVATTTVGGTRSQLDNGSVAMAGAASSAAPTFGDYFGIPDVQTGVTTLFEAEGGFDLFAFDGISEEDYVGFNSAVKTWAHTNNDAGRYMFVVVGGGQVELSTADTATALTRTAIFDAVDPGLPSHPEFIANIGVSGLEITSPAGNVLQLTSAQSTPRLAGMIAKQGIIGSITFADTGADAVNGSLTPIQIEALIQEGLIIFSKRGDFVRVEDGVTTFISETEEKDFTFTQVRAARAIQQIGLDISEIVENDWIGQKINTTSVRDSLVATLQTYFSQLEAQQVLVNGTQVQIDTRYDNTRTNVFILVLAKFQFELKRVLLTIRVPTVS